jgi:hypothetical protein
MMRFAVFVRKAFSNRSEVQFTETQRIRRIAEYVFQMAPVESGARPALLEFRL